MASTRAAALALYRSLLRTGREFTDYNVREYVKRRAREGFIANRALSASDAIERCMADGAAQLEVARRQAAVYALYGKFSRPSAMEVT
jgi:hypothetical protein